MADDVDLWVGCRTQTDTHTVTHIHSWPFALWRYRMQADGGPWASVTDCRGGGGRWGPSGLFAARRSQLCSSSGCKTPAGMQRCTITSFAFTDAHLCSSSGLSSSRMG
jgi:hypothetical protein